MTEDHNAVSFLYKGVSGNQNGLFVAYQSANGNSARQQYLFDGITCYAYSLFDVEFGHIGTCKGQTFDVGNIGI